MKSGDELIAQERERQLSVEGWTPSHDDEHANAELVGAAIAYASWGVFEVQGEGRGSRCQLWLPICR